MTTLRPHDDHADVQPFGGPEPLETVEIRAKDQSQLTVSPANLVYRPARYRYDHIWFDLRRDRKEFHPGQNVMSSA